MVEYASSRPESRDPRQNEGSFCAGPEAGYSPARWAENGRRYRLAVQCPRRHRSSSAPRPVEVAVDFPLLFEKSGLPGAFDPRSVVVVDRAAGRRVPFARRASRDPETGRKVPVLSWYALADVFDLYFDARELARAVSPVRTAGEVPPGNLLENADFSETAKGGLPAAWRVEPASFVSALERPGGRGERSLRLGVDGTEPPDSKREVSVSQVVEVSRFAGQGVFFECDLLAMNAPFGVPMTVEIRQFDAGGALLPNFVVQPRYLSLELAEGQPVTFCETGRFHAAAVTCEVRVRFRLSVLDNDTGEVVSGPEARMKVRLDRVALRPAERWPWPALSRGGFVAGAFPGEPFDGAFEFTGRRRVFFNGASEACLTSGQLNPDPRGTHWGPAAGTLEFYFKPSWDAGDGRRHVLFEGQASATGRLQCALRKQSDGRLFFVIADSGGQYHAVKGPAPFMAGRWHHVAATWDYARSSLGLFLDGRRIASAGPGPVAWPFSALPGAEVDFPGVGVGENDRRSVPLQAFIGGDRSFDAGLGAEGAIDDFRISDLVRYEDDFTVPGKPCTLDRGTRALWHFDGETDGIHDGDDGRVRSFPACELPPRRESADFEFLGSDGRLQRLSVLFSDCFPEAVFEANRAETRLPVVRPLTPPPDPRYLVFSEQSAELSGDSARSLRLTAGGDYPPVMRSISFASAKSGSHPLPRWRANDNVVPYSIRSLRETLAPGEKDEAEKSVRVMAYADRVTNYFNSRFCETLAAKNRPRLGLGCNLLKMINIYPLDQCGPLNSMLRKLFLALGISSNNAFGSHHQYQQAFYRGHWRVFDLSSRIYFLRRDNRRVAGRRELEGDPWLILRQGKNPSMMIPGSVSEATFGQAIRPHDMTFTLRDGERVGFSWYNEGKWFELTGDREPALMETTPPIYGNGVITFEPTAEAGDALETENLGPRAAGRGTDLITLDPARPSSLTYLAACPYIFSGAAITGRWTADRPVEAVVSFSSDDGKTWHELWRGSGRRGRLDMSLGDHPAARYAWRLKAAFSAGDVVVSGFRVRSVFVDSPFVHPETLRRGVNLLRPAEEGRRVPVNARLSWVQRYSSDLGVSLNGLSFYLDGDRTHRNVFIVPPGGRVPLAVAFRGRAAEGRLVLENLPGGWRGASARLLREAGTGETVVKLPLETGRGSAGEIHAFDVVLEEKKDERRIRAQVFSVDSPLVTEAENALETKGCAVVVDLPEASGARVLDFHGPGEASYGLEPGFSGTYALWLRARWTPGAATDFRLRVGDGVSRSLCPKPLEGLSSWDNPEHASAKMFRYFGEQFAHFAWFRIPGVVLEADTRLITLAAGEGATFDALALLPQVPEIDRPAMNLFQNWNYAPWEIPSQ